MDRIVFIVISIIVGVIVLSDTFIFAFVPSAANSVVTHTSTLVAIGTSSTGLLVLVGRLFGTARDTNRKVNMVVKNVNGNLSAALAMLANASLSDEDLETVKSIQAGIDATPNPDEDLKPHKRF